MPRRGGMRLQSLPGAGLDGASRGATLGQRARRGRGAHREGERDSTMGTAGCAGGARRTQDPPSRPTPWQREARPQAQDQMTAAGDGSVTHQARSGGGPGKGVLADTRRSDGGGSTASFRCRRIFRMTSPCVMAAMIRSVPADKTGNAPYPGQTPTSAVVPSPSAATRCPVAASAIPCWRGVGMMAPRR